jgi:hypothetical protein
VTKATPLAAVESRAVKALIQFNSLLEYGLSRHVKAKADERWESHARPHPPGQIWRPTAAQTFFEGEEEWGLWQSSAFGCHGQGPPTCSNQNSLSAKH